MIIDVLRFLLWPANVSDQAPNHAELEAAHAAWAGVFVSFLALITTVIAAVFAARAFRSQQAALASQQEALRFEMSARRLERKSIAAAAANAVSLVITQNADPTVVMLTSVTGDRHTETHFRFSNQSGGWLRNLTFENPAIRSAAVFLGGDNEWEPNQEHEVAPLAPGVSFDIKFMGFSANYADHVLAAHGPSFRWTDTDGNIWRCSQLHGVVLVSEGPDIYSPK